MEKDIEKLSEEVYNKLLEDDGFEWTMDRIKENPQEFLDTLDSWWDVDDFDESDLINNIDTLYRKYKFMKTNLYNNYIELGSNRTVWECNTLGDPDLEIYDSYVQKAIEEFKSRTGIEVFLLGRSGRHVCVEHNYKNAIKFFELCDLQQDLEDWVIKSYNSRPELIESSI